MRDPRTTGRVCGTEEKMMFGSTEAQARPHDPAHIHVEDAGELAYWTEALKVDEPTLRGAIQAVGFGADDVRDYLKMRMAATHTA
jgi:hypothetical protein